MARGMRGELAFTPAPFPGEGVECHFRGGGNRVWLLLSRASRRAADYNPARDQDLPQRTLTPGPSPKRRGEDFSTRCLVAGESRSIKTPKPSGGIPDGVISEAERNVCNRQEGNADGAVSKAERRIQSHQEGIPDGAFEKGIPDGVPDGAVSKGLQ